MLKVLLNGLVFGFGFFVAVGGCLMLYWNWVSDYPVDASNPFSTAAWHDSTPENKIASSSIILLVEFRKDMNGDLKPFVAEFIKREESVPFYYEEGDFYQPLSKGFYEHAEEGNKVLLLFVDDLNLSTMSVNNGTVSGLSDIPLARI